MSRRNLLLLAALLALFGVAGARFLSRPGPDVTRVEPAPPDAAHALAPSARSPEAKPESAAAIRSPASAPTSAEAPLTGPGSSQEPDAAARPAPPPLEALLKLPSDESGPASGLDVDRNPHLRVPANDPAEAGAGPGLRDRVRVEHREEAAGVPGPREAKVGQTDAGVRVPVKDSVDVWGGVRVDSRRESDGKVDSVDTTPKAGIDVRF